MQAAHEVTEAAVQVVGNTESPTQDVAGQAKIPPAVKDVFCPDRDFWMASRAEHERDRRDRDHQQREDRKRTWKTCRRCWTKASVLISKNVLIYTLHLKV